MRNMNKKAVQLLLNSDEFKRTHLVKMQVVTEVTGICQVSDVAVMRGEI